MIGDGDSVTIGAPAIDGAAVEAKVVKHLKGDKVIVFKKKRRKGYRKKNGHRQYLTELMIEEIVAKGAKKAAPKKEKPAKSEAAPAKKSEPAKDAKAESAKKEAPAKTAPKAPEDLSSKTVAELREMAKAQEITGYSSMKKAELIEALGGK